RADAAALAARLPDAHLLQVQDAAHGVLFSDATDCAERAVAAFLDGRVLGPCRRHPRAAPPSPLPPQRLEQLRAAGHPGGRIGRTVTAVVRTLDDATDQLIAQVLTTGQAHPFGALRAGSAVLERGRGLRLRAYVYVPGVAVSGLVPASRPRFTLTVGGRAAAHGRVTLSRGGLTGELDGEQVDVSARALGWRSPSTATVAALGLGTTGSLAPSLAPPSLRAPLAR
ncbi:MAG TPA: hypothetical protein VK506_07705, partial [Conexibacter sp.]|nr:hypothetical protein [Conexibacter sp.]